MANYTTSANVVLSINGRQAQNMMASLERDAKRLERQIAKAATAGDKATMQKLNRELSSVRRTMEQLKGQSTSVDAVLRRLDKASPKDLQRTLRTLQQQLNGIQRGSKAWDAHIAKIQAVKTELQRVNATMAAQKSLWSRMNSWLNSCQTAILAVGAAITGLVMAGRKAVNAFAEMEEQLANTRKYTGMTADDVDKLNEAFKRMDTRTPREKLNELAQEAGRLGFNTLETVQGYVEAADIINVALVDLGEGATQTIAKLTNIFGVQELLGTKDAMLAVGSTVNVLSQNCTASKPYLVEFAQRMAGIGSQAGLTIPQILAFGAVLDANGQKVEMSATAIQKVIMNLANKNKEFAATLGLDAQKLNETLKHSAKDGLLMFLEALQRMGESVGYENATMTLAPAFKEMGLDAARVSQVLSTLAMHLDEVKWQMGEADKAFAEATSATKEYEIFNNTAQASIDKAKKRVNELAVELGEKLYPIMKHIYTSSGIFLRMLNVIVDFVIKHKTAIVALTVALTAYTVVVNLATIKKKALNAIDTVHYGLLVLQSKAVAALTIVTESLKIAYYNLTGQTTKAVAAQQALSTAMKAAPWGAILAAISAALIALETFGKETKELIINLDILKNAEAEANAKLMEEKTILEQNIVTLKNFNGTKSDEEKLLISLNEKYGGFFGTCKTLKEWYETLTKGGDDYCNAIYRQILMEAKRQQALDLAKKAEEARQKGLSGEGITNGDHLYEFVYNLRFLPSWDHLSWDEAYDEVYRRNKANWDNYADQLDAQAKRLIDEYAAELASQTPFSTPTRSNPSTTPTTLSSSTNTNSNASPPSQTTKDKFEVEKQKRELEEAKARISYATGKTDYIQFTEEMDQIAVTYFKRILERTDLSNAERLTFSAEYYEAEKKLSDDQWNNMLEDETYWYNDRMARLRQFYIDGKITKETFDQQVEETEIQHQKNLIGHFEAGSKERVQAEQQLQSLLIAQVQRRQQETEKLEAQYASMKQDYFGDNPKEAQEKYDADLKLLDVVYQRELQAAGNNAAEKLRIDEAYEQAKLALKKKYGLLAEEDTRNAMQSSIDTTVEWLESDGGKALLGAMSTITSGMSAIFSQLSSLMQAELDIQTAQIEKRYEKEISQAEGNSYKIAQLERQKEAEIAKAKNEANRKLFAMQVIQAVAQTATNALNAYGSAAQVPMIGYILAPIAASMAIAAGAIQIAAIKKQQQASEAQGYMSGGFTPEGRVDEVAGVVHKGEWVASQRLVRNPQTRPLIEALDYAQRNNTIGSIRMADVSRTITAPAVLAAQSASSPQSVVNNTYVTPSADNSELTSTIRELKERLNEPFVTVNTVAGDLGIQKAQDDYSKLMRNKSPKSKR